MNALFGGVVGQVLGAVRVFCGAAGLKDKCTPDCRRKSHSNVAMNKKGDGTAPVKTLPERNAGLG
jgi:hypothetical protein